MKPIRVLVVDDSLTARTLICSLLEAASDIQVCAEAATGRQALELTHLLKPDVITMDLRMPEMDGLSAIAEIMARQPTPILVLSDLADSHLAVAAVAQGALEAMPKPTPEDGDVLAGRLRLLAGVPVIRHIRRTAPALDPPCQARLLERPQGLRERIIAIAASTGGPQALAILLPKLPAGLRVPILIAQHLSPGFAEAMAAWLTKLAPMEVEVARPGERPRPGRVYLADPAGHLFLDTERRFCYLAPAKRDIYHPSCDRLLSSVAERYGPGTIGVILTGMGRDGVRGLLAIRAAGGRTLAQDEGSSLIFGMNREAILSGAVEQVLPLSELAPAICRLLEPIA